MKMEEITYLKEGGYALKSANVTRIVKSDIPATIKYVSEVSGIPLKDLEPLGSVGKTDTSGDVDLAVDITKYNPTTIHNKLTETLGDGKTVYNKATQIGSYAIPIGGKGDKTVQVDLMYVSNVDWARFAYYSAGNDSKYKGAVRTILMMGVAAALNEPGFDHFEYDNEELIIRAGRTLDLSKGLRRIFQHRPKKVGGKGYIKSMKTIPVDEFKRMFPDVKIKGGDVIIDNPETVVQSLFGVGTKVSDVRTAEQVLDLIKKKFNKQQQDRILSIAKSRASGVEGKMLLPKELM